MPYGMCRGCGDEGPLPPFGGGLCFLCATDGPPGDRSTTGRAVAEDAAAPDPTAGWNEELSEDQIAILELFAEASVLSERGRVRAALFADALTVVRYPDAGAWYADRKAAGLCTRCSAQATPGGWCGSKEAARQRARLLRDGDSIRQSRRALRALHKANGRCVECRDAAAPGSSYCGTHAEAKAARRPPLDIERALAAKNQARKTRLGLCRWCSALAMPGLRFCAKHREDNRTRQAARWAEARDAGRCERCKEPATDGRCCAKHREAERERVRARRRRAKDPAPVRPS